MMKKHYKHLAVLGTLCCLAALAVLWLAVLTVDWVSIQEPQLDPLELDKLGPYEEPRPHLIRAKFGLFKMCIQQQNSFPKSSSIGLVDSLVHNSNSNNNVNTQSVNYGSGSSITSTISFSPVECIDLDWYNFGIINFDLSRKPVKMPTELIANCVEKLRFTLPFIGLSVLFTSISFLCLTFGYFCQKNKKIIEASLLILAGLCQATALLTFVSQIGSEFEANLPFSHHHKRLTTFYRYKYGYSFYLFLLSFSLSELAALFDMAAYFRKYPPNHYVITFHRQEPSPFMGNETHVPASGSIAQGTNSLQHNHHLLHHHPQTSTAYQSDSLRSNHNSYSTNNTGSLTYANNYNHHSHHTYSQYNNPMSPNNTTNNSATVGTLTKQQQGPDLCYDFINNGTNSDQMIDLTLHHSLRSHGTMSNQHRQQAQLGDDNQIPPPQSFMNPEVTITTIERNNGYGTVRNNKIPTSSAMESFGTMRKENNI